MELFIKAMENDLAYVMKNAKFLGVADTKGKTLLHYATLGSADDVIDYLLSQEVDVNAVDNHGETALFDCARKAKLSIAKKLIRRYAKLNIQNNNEETVLHLAAAKGNLEFIKLLVENHVHLNVKTNDARLPVHYAILSGHVDVVSYLVTTAKTSWFYQDEYQNSFLHYAAKTTNYHMIDMLLNESLDPNGLNDQFETPLFYAVRFGTNETVLRLLKAGAIIDLVNRRFETPFNVAKIFEQDEILTLLTEYQESVEYQNLIKEHALTVAVLNRDHHRLKELILNGAKLKKDNLNFTALDYAIKYKLSVCISLLRAMPKG